MTNHLETMNSDNIDRIMPYAIGPEFEVWNHNRTIFVYHNRNVSTLDDTSRAQDKTSTHGTDTMPSIGFLGTYNASFTLFMDTYYRAQLHALIPSLNSFPFFALVGTTST